MTAHNSTVRAVDLFAGSGGTSTGLVRACERLGRKIELTAVDHWPLAIETHSSNYPWARHECARIDELDPKAVAPKGQIDILVASPECTHFSRARGAAPKDGQSRASGWDVLRWVEQLRPRDVIMENVAEWRDWGPIDDSTGEAIEGRKGETFAAFVDALSAIGYRVEWRLLNAADYGAATTRVRLFVRARRGRRAPMWPLPSHAKTRGGLLDLGATWRPASEIIDWALPSRSIFGRAKPLRPKTLARIERGIAKFWGAYAEPFLVLLRGTGSARSVDLPLPTLTAGGQHVGVVEPFIVTPGGCDLGGPRSARDPLPTVMARDRFAVVEPFMLSQGSTGAPRPVSQPAPTIVTAGAVAMVEPILLPYDIRFRMLQPDELRAAMGFPAGYRLAGNRGDQVKQIGNAVCVDVAEALCAAALTDALDEEDPS